MKNFDEMICNLGIDNADKFKTATEVRENLRREIFVDAFGDEEMRDTSQDDLDELAEWIIEKRVWCTNDFDAEK